MRALAVCRAVVHRRSHSSPWTTQRLAATRADVFGYTYVDDPNDHRQSFSHLPTERGISAMPSAAMPAPLCIERLKFTSSQPIFQDQLGATTNFESEIVCHVRTSKLRRPLRASGLFGRLFFHLTLEEIPRTVD